MDTQKSKQINSLAIPFSFYKSTFTNPCFTNPVHVLQYVVLRRTYLRLHKSDDVRLRNVMQSDLPFCTAKSDKEQDFAQFPAPF